MTQPWYEIQWRVQDLQARYARCIDEDHLEAWPGFFAEDCLYTITSADNEARGLPMGIVYARSRAMLEDRVTALRQANIFEAQRYRHVLGVPLLVDPAPDSAATAGPGPAVVRTETGFVVVRIMRDGTSTLFASGTYRDRIRLEGDRGAIRFEEKRVICDSHRIDTLLALPL